jgi:hypothetical protein
MKTNLSKGAFIFGLPITVFAAHFMFDLDLLNTSTKLLVRSDYWLGEFVATFGVAGVILACLKAHPDAVPMAVGLYITPFWQPVFQAASGR